MTQPAKPKIALREVTRANFNAIVKLKVAEHQLSWVASNMESLAQAYVNHRLTPLGIYDGALFPGEADADSPLVGFVMYQVWDDVGFVMRLMVGEAFQGKGYGRAAMEEVIRQMRMIPEIRIIATSVIPENEAATNLYLSLGFVDNPWARKDTGERYLMLDWPGKDD